MLRLIFGLLPFLLNMAADSAGDNSGAGDGDDDDSDNTGDTPGKKGGSEPKTFTQDDLDRILGKEKKKLADAVRDEVRQEIEAEAKRKADEEAGEYKPLYETEKQKREAAENQVGEVAQGFRRRLAKVETEKAAAEHNLIEPDLAFRLIDFDQITFNDDDEPTNITDLVKKLATDRPGLVKAVSNRDGSKPVPKGDNAPTTKDDYATKYRKQAGVEV